MADKLLGKAVRTPVRRFVLVAHWAGVDKFPVSLFIKTHQKHCRRISSVCSAQVCLGECENKDGKFFQRASFTAGSLSGKPT